MPEGKERDECKCGQLARLAEDPRDPVEFDPQLKEYHLMRRAGTLLAPPGGRMYPDFVELI